MDKWKRQDINNLDFKELCESFYYYRRKMGYGPAAVSYTHLTLPTIA